MVFLEYRGGLEQVVDRIFHSLLGEYNGFTISVSMGIAKSGPLASSYDALLYCADRALYFAKNAGRGQYCFYKDSMKDMFSVISPIEEEKKED